MAVFQVEPLLAAMADETSVSIKARVLLRKPGITVCQSVIHQQIFSTTIGLDFQAGEFSILDGVLKHINNHLWLEQGSQTEVISRPPPNLSIPLKAIEICSGIGAGATGLQACGISTQVFNDMNPKYCAWLERKAEISQKVVQGDINSSSVIRDIADAAAHAQLLSAGISRQPFNSLGDRREQHDDRSKSFTGTLRASHHLGPAWILLECTKEARFSQWAQAVLSDFCKQTGYQLQQKILDLHRTWPAFRTRWFAVLTHPHLQSVPIPSMPTLPWIPSMLHLAPGSMPLAGKELEDLTLDFHELRAFNDTPKGVHGSIVNMCKPMATATHSWGSQVKPCECDCRAQGFTAARLRDRGLYGQLIPLGEDVTFGKFTFHSMRHLHPKEVALFNGLKPTYVDISGIGSTRFELTGTGQMASPLQIAWIVSNILHQTCNSDPWRQVEHPMMTMRKMFEALFTTRDVVWNVQEKTLYMSIFEQAILKMTGHEAPEPLEIPFTQQMFEQAARFEASLARTARTAQVTQNIMPVVTPLPAVSRHAQVLPQPSRSTRQQTSRSKANDALPTPSSALPIPTAHPAGASDVNDSGLPAAVLTDVTKVPVDFEGQATLPHPPMIPENVLADPAHLPDVTGPSQTEVPITAEPFVALPRFSMMPEKGEHAEPALPNYESTPAHTKVPQTEEPNTDVSHIPRLTEPVVPADSAHPIGVYGPSPTKVPEVDGHADTQVCHTSDATGFSHADPARSVEMPGHVHTEALDDIPMDAKGPHLPMSDAPFHANPAHQPSVTGSSQGGDNNSNPAESRDLTTLPPMCKPSVHADPTHLPDVLGPSHVILPAIAAFAAGAVPQDDLARTQLDTAAISTVIDTMPFAATDTIADEKSVHQSKTDAIFDFADPGHALVGPAAEVQDTIVAPEPTTPYTHNGGVSFSKRPANDLFEAPNVKRQRVTDLDAAVAATAPWTQPITEVHSDQQAVMPAIDALPVQVGIWPEPLHQVMVQRGTTTPQLAAAEAAIRESGTQFNITDILGRSIPEDGTLIKDYIVLMFPQDDPVTDVEANLRVHTVDERLTKLWYQEGFVATDKMKFYLRSIHDASVAAHPTVFSSPSSIEAQVADIIDQAIDIAAAGNMAYSVTVACLFQGHWMPLKVDIKNDTVTLYTTSEGYRVFVSHAPQAINSGYQWKCIDVPVSFPNDCGFRCIEWIRNFRSYVDVI